MPIIYASRYLGISEVLFSVELYPAGEPVEHIGNIQVLYLSLSVREDLKTTNRLMVPLEFGHCQM